MHRHAIFAYLYVLLTCQLKCFALPAVEVAANYLGCQPAVLRQMPSSEERHQAMYVLRAPKGPVLRVVLVDTAIGRVVGDYNLQMSPLDSAVPASDATAQLAVDFAARIAARAWPECSRSGTERTVHAVRHGQQVDAYVIAWRERRDEAYTGSVLVVSVCGIPPRLRHWRLHLASPATTPRQLLERAKAEALAVRWLSDHGVASSSVHHAELILSFPLSVDAGPVWIIHASSPQGDRDCCIDALSGAMLLPEISFRDGRP